MTLSFSPEIRVSVDIGCKRHAVAIGLSNGELLDEFEIDQTPKVFGLFFDTIERHEQRLGYPVAVAMEGYNGWARPLDKMTLERHYRLFNINTLKLARFK